MDNTASPAVRRMRVVYCTVNLIIPFVGALTTVTTLDTMMTVEMVWSRIVMSLSCLAVAIWVLCRRHLSERIIVAHLYCVGGFILLFDLQTRVFQIHSWPLLVIIADVLLVMRIDQRYTIGFVTFAVFCLAVFSAESVLRFGLFDVPGTAPYEDRTKFFLRALECERPPCSTPMEEEATLLFVGLVVFVCDFIATRGFANQVLSEQAAMEHTISVVQDVASLLAKYDVEGVARLLAAHEAHLPSRMHVTLQTMEQNLRMYRPYLPAALFEVSEDTTRSSVVVAPPGVASETATLVFTDIRASTSIWEGAPEGMRAGLKIHNTVMRDVMQAFGGYEVKTIGDAFMIAFASTEDGVMFGLRVQEELLAADWPLSLLEDAPICAPQASLWGGLTVRIGVNTGPVAVELNALTGRTDYFGHTVNVAARLESNCIPGAVAVRSDLWSECSFKRSASTVSGQPMSLELKGVSEKVLVNCLWPASLGGRQHCALRESADVNPLTGDSESAHDTVSLTRFPTLRPAAQFAATVGVVDVAVGDEGSSVVLQSMSAGLSSLTVALDQSGGVLVTLLGSCVCVGWNLTRPTPSHMECAIHFAQRVQETSATNGTGLASGKVQHGDVGARTQRFVTVMGSVVRRSWALCEQAVQDRVPCLYEPPEGTALPSSLEHALTATSRRGVYMVHPERSVVQEFTPTEKPLQEESI